MMLAGCSVGEKKVASGSSTSMQKIMGNLSEQDRKDIKGVSVTYNPTGSGFCKLRTVP